MAASPDAVLHLAALHTLASAGFASTSRAASLTLSGVLARYLQLVASSCAERAALAGRSKVAAIDVVNALDDLGVGGITELQEWTTDLDKEVTFTGGRLDELAGYLRDGLASPEGIDRFYVPVDDADAGDELDEGELEGVDGSEEESEREGVMEVRSPAKAGASAAGSPRAASPEKASSPLKHGSPAKRDSPSRPGSPLKLGSPTKEASPLRDGSPVKASSPTKVASPLPVKDGSPVKSGTPVPGSPVKASSPLPASPAKAGLALPASPVKSGTPLPGSPAKSPAVQPGSPIKAGSPVKLGTPLPGTPGKTPDALPGSPIKTGSPVKAGSPVKPDSLVKADSLVKEEPDAMEGAPKEEAAELVSKEDGHKDVEGVSTDVKDVAKDVPVDDDVKMAEDDDAVGEKDARAKLEDTTKEGRKDDDRDSPMDVDEAHPRAASPQLPTPPPSPPYIRVNYRPRSPDMSWLPPLPTADVQTLASAGAELAEVAPEPQSLFDKYRQPVAFRNSQLAAQLKTDKKVFVDPPKPREEPYIPPAPTSFHALVTAYEATATEPSVALRQTDGRRQAADLLRLTVGNPDRFSTRDTLAQPLAPPHISPIVPSHSDVLPSRLLPVNPNQNGVISSILHQIRTPYLPPPLRERLTSLRPPQAQTNEQGPVLYGEPVRGADDAALAKARGKATGEEPTAVFRATWDSGPKGQEKWSRGRLPTGRKVTKAAVGASAPREEGTKPLRLKISDRVPGVSMPDTPAFSPSTTLKLRLGAGKTAGTPTVERTLSNANLGGSSSETNADAVATPTSGSMPLRLNFAGSSAARQKSASPSKRRTASPSKRLKQEPMQLD